MEKSDASKAEKFFTQELSRVMKRPIPVAITELEFAEITIPNPPYHKAVSRAICDEMGRAFNPLVAGFLVANIRADGKVALVDGRHRRQAAENCGRKSWWFILTEGLSVQEEAILFRHFQRRKNMSAAERLRALLLEGDRSATELKAAAHSAGFAFPFEDDSERMILRAVGDMLTIFSMGGAAGVKRILRLLHPLAMENPRWLEGLILKGVWRFVSSEEVRAKIPEDTLLALLRAQSPDWLAQAGRRVALDERCNAQYGVAQALRSQWNRGDAGKQTRIEQDFTETDKVAQGRRMSELPVKRLVADAGLQAELERNRQGLRQRWPREFLKEAVRLRAVGYSTGQIAQAYDVSDKALQTQLRLFQSALLRA